MCMCYVQKKEIITNIFVIQFCKLAEVFHYPAGQSFVFPVFLIAFGFSKVGVF